MIQSLLRSHIAFQQIQSYGIFDTCKWHLQLMCFSYQQADQKKNNPKLQRTPLYSDK